MRPVQFVGPALLVVGVAVLALSVAEGEASVYLVVIVPVVAGTGPLAFLGILLVFMGFFLTFLLWPFWLAGPPLSEKPVPPEPPATIPPRTERRWGGVMFLGPIPIVFGSDPRVTRAMLLLGLVLFLALLALTILVLLA